MSDLWPLAKIIMPACVICYKPFAYIAVCSWQIVFHLSGLVLKKDSSLVKVKIAPKLHPLWSAERRSSKNETKSSPNCLNLSYL